MTKQLNQVHSPMKKTKTSDSLGNDRRRLYLKKSDCTMLFCKGITKNAGGWRHPSALFLQRLICGSRSDCGSADSYPGSDSGSGSDSADCSADSDSGFP